MTVKLLLITTVLLALSTNLVKADIINGTFDSDLSSWNTSIGDGNAEKVENGMLALTETNGFFPSGVIQGDDFSFSFANSLLIANNTESLSFRVRVESENDQTGEMGVIDDILRVSIFDSIDFNLDLELLYGAGSPITNVFQTVTIDITTFVSRNVAIAFEVLPGIESTTSLGNGLTSTFFIDNVQFNTASSPVSSPSSLIMICLALALLFGKKYLIAFTERKVAGGRS